MYYSLLYYGFILYRVIAILWVHVFSLNTFSLYHKTYSLEHNVKGNVINLIMYIKWSSDHGLEF